MSLQLERDDFDRLVRILVAMPEFQDVRSRMDFINDTLRGSPRESDIRGSLNLDGRPRGVAVRTVDQLARFGQDRPGQETLGVLINRMIEYIGSGEDADFLYGMLRRYPFQITPVAKTDKIVAWHGRDDVQAVNEKIIGENTLRHLFTLDLALTAAQAVVRIATPASLGSGFLVARDLLMTNHHVLPDAATAQQSEVTFNYQLDARWQEVPVQPANLQPERLFYTNAALDMTVVALGKFPADVAPLKLKRRRVPVDSRVTIIQHPGGHYKKISMQNNFVVYADAQVVQYTTSTEPGSSGSPVLDDDFNVIALHRRGGMLPQPDTQRRYLRNEGTSSIAILDDLRQHAPAIDLKLGK